jgi:hypothetical protein
LHFQLVEFHTLIKYSNFWHLWHWFMRLFRNSVTCKVFSFMINSFLITFSTSFLHLRLILIDECVLFSLFFVRVNQIDSRASVMLMYNSIALWIRLIDSSIDAISTSCIILSNQISSSWIDLIENSLSQIDRHWINWSAMFFSETMNTILFFVLDKLIKVIKIFIFASCNLFFIRFLHSDELISITKFFENIIILRLFHCIVSFNFVV